MGKTYRENIVDSRSVLYKSDRNRGWAREKDKHSHHSHRNTNLGCDECSYVPFNKDFKRNDRDRTFQTSYQRSNLHNDCRDLNTFFAQNGWEHGTLKQNIVEKIRSELLDKEEKNYLKKSLKQVERRGRAAKFTGHDKFSEKPER